MNKLYFRSPNITLGLALFASMTVYAQSEKLVIRMVPEPNQVIRMRIIQEMEIDMSLEGASPADAAPSGPIKMVSKTVFAMTQKVGAADDQGVVTSEVTYDEVSSETSINGQPSQVGDVAGKFIGKKIIVSFNKQWELVDIKIPPDIGLPEESFRQMMKSVYGNLPKTPIGVGEIATSPLDFTMPLPVPGAPPIKVEGQIKFKLVSVEKDASSRIAKYDQTVDGKIISEMDIPTPNGTVKMNVDFTMNGAGDLMMNADKGFVRSNDSKTTFGGKIKMASNSGETKLPGLNLQGSIKMSITGSN